MDINHPAARVYLMTRHHSTPSAGSSNPDILSAWIGLGIILLLGIFLIFFVGVKKPRKKI